MAQFKLRLPEPLRHAVEQSAKRSGNSLNAEICARLEKSFRDEDRWGGPELLAVAERVMAAFRHGGRLGARAMGHPEWTPQEWTADPGAFTVAVAAAVDELQGIQTISAKMSDPAAVARVMDHLIARQKQGEEK